MSPWFIESLPSSIRFWDKLFDTFTQRLADLLVDLVLRELYQWVDYLMM